MKENKEEQKKEAATEKKKFRLNIHVVFGLTAAVMLGIIISKFVGFGRTITQEDIDAVPVPDNPEIEVLDQLFPLTAENDGTFPEDDGVTTIVCIGNSPFSDDRDSEDNLCSMLAAKTGATVYNCSIPNSYVTACDSTCQPSVYPMDIFSFYFLTTIFADNNTEIISPARDAMFGFSEETEESLALLQSIDFETVDAIVVMYDGTDYLLNKICYRDDVIDSPHTYTGALTAGISLIQEKFPWIRVVVMSPTYAYAVAEDGSYVSSDRQQNKQTNYLSTYVLFEAQTAYSLGASFVDVFYGGIHEDIASDYLTDNIHLNRKGREVVLDRIIEGIQKYTPIYGFQSSSDAQ